MALNHTIFMGTYRPNPAGPGSIVRATSLGATSINVAEDYYNAVDDYALKRGFVFDGRVYIPSGSTYSGGTLGWVSYSPDINLFHHTLHWAGNSTGLIIPFGDRVGFIGSIWSGWGETPEIFHANALAGSCVPADYAILGNNIYLIDSSVQCIWVFSYPFTSFPSYVVQAGGIAATTRICELDGVVYVLKVVNNSTNTLYKIVNNSLITVGTFTYPNDNAYSSALPTTAALWGYNSKLFVAQGMNSGASQKVRCYQINISPFSLTDLSSSLPAGWKAPNATGYGYKVFEVRDDANATEQVFLVMAGPVGVGAWDLIEYTEPGGTPTFTPIVNGGQTIYPYCGVVYDESTHGADIKGVAINQSSNYAMLQIGVSDLQGNGNVDIDPRYRDLANVTVDPPYSAMSDKGPGVGSEGKTGLSSKPASPTTLPGLSDNFADGIIDTNLWRIVMPHNATSCRDAGCGHSTTKPYYTIEEISGELRLGNSTLDTAVTNVGIGLKSKWFMKDDFEVDFTIANPNSLSPTVAPGSLYICAMIKTITNRGYGFRVYRNSTGPTNRARGMYYLYNTVPIQSADSAVATVADGTVIRIARNGSDVWSVILDPAGAVGGPEVLTPAGGANYSEDVQIWIYGMTLGVPHWAASAPAPGFKDITVTTSGGTLGRFDDYRLHNFAWDYGNDIGAGVTFAAEPYVDTD